MVAPGTARPPQFLSKLFVLDFPEAENLDAWVEDLRADTDRAQCLLAAASTGKSPHIFSQILLESLTAAELQEGMPAAGWITQLQGRLALSAIYPLFLADGEGGDRSAAGEEYCPSRGGSGRYWAVSV